MQLKQLASKQIVHLLSTRSTNVAYQSALKQSTKSREVVQISLGRTEADSDILVHAYKKRRYQFYAPYTVGRQQLSTVLQGSVTVSTYDDPACATGWKKFSFVNGQWEFSQNVGLRQSSTSVIANSRLYYQAQSQVFSLQPSRQINTVTLNFINARQRPQPVLIYFPNNHEQTPKLSIEPVDLHEFHYWLHHILSLCRKN